MIRPATSSEFDWLTKRTGYLPGGDFVAFLAERDGSILGLVGFDAWKPNSCQAHVAVDEPMVGLGLARTAFRFVFEFSGRELMLGTVAQRNTGSLELARRLGFIETHRTLDGWAKGEALVGLELRKENCRWLRSGAATRRAA